MVSRRLGGIFVLKKKSLHRDMADVNVYTARRLKDMAMSLSGLAQAFADEIGGGRQLTKDDGLAAMQTAAAAVCGDAICTQAAKERTAIIFNIFSAHLNRKGKSTWRTCPGCSMRRAGERMIMSCI